MKNWTILDELKADQRPMVASCLALVGPKQDLADIHDKLKDMFERIYIFHVPDDYGEFPDTTGYSKENWESLESTMEDPALYPFMTKAVDAIVEFNNNRMTTLDRLSCRDIESFVHAPKFGGKIWAVAGFIRAFEPYKEMKIIVPHTIH